MNLGKEIEKEIRDIVKMINDKGQDMQIKVHIDKLDKLLKEYFKAK